jgi:hypothetical protein
VINSGCGLIYGIVRLCPGGAEETLKIINIIFKHPVALL